MSEYIIKVADQWAIGYNGVSLYEGCEEIVRCRDCRWLEKDDTFYDCQHFACHLCWNDGHKPDGFCSWGVRREA